MDVLIATEAAAVARLHEHRAVVFTPEERWYADAETAALLAEPESTYAVELRARNDELFALVHAMPPLPEPKHSRPCLSCLCLFETTDSCADLCPDCTSHYTHAMLQDERNGEEDRP